jgi:putative oxidoreductase
MLFFGWRVRLAAVLLLLFLLPTTIIVHDFWHLNAGMGCPETEIFLRNTGLIGALLLVLAYGKGCGSSKEKATPKNP